MKSLKVVEINTVFNGSTGKIMRAVASLAQHNNMKVYCFAGYSAVRPDDQCYNIGTKLSPYIHSKLSYVFGNPEMHSTIETRKLIEQLKVIDPDIIHLHNLHGFYLNVPVLIEFIKKKNIKIVWTLHDCWSFTGRCPHFQVMGCDKWRNGCSDCKMPRSDYPPTIFDVANKMWNKKKSWFTNINALTIVTPSEWLASLVKESYLKEYPVKVINNGIDLSVFQPKDSGSRKKLGISEKKFVLLGVSFAWGYKKGLDVFLELSSRLDSDKFQIVLVGTNDSVDRQLPANIISIHRTHNQQELAEIYSVADLFVNPTREDTFPTVNMEAIACGTPVLTFATGGSPEIVSKETGSVVECNDIDAMEQEILRIYKTKPVTKESCINRSKDFDMNDRFQDYIELYKEICR